MSEYSQILPGLWSVRCLDYKLGGCAGPAFGADGGVFICEFHARGRGLIGKPEPSVKEEALPVVEKVSTGSGGSPETQVGGRGP